MAGSLNLSTGVCVAALWAAMSALMAGRGLTLGWLYWRLERGGRLLAGQGTAQSV